MIHDEDLRSSLDYSEGQKAAAESSAAGSRI